MYVFLHVTKGSVVERNLYTHKYSPQLFPGQIAVANYIVKCCFH